MGRRRKVNHHFYHHQPQTGPMFTQGYIPKHQYNLNEKLDLTESRSIEFKLGPGFINNHFQESVGKYVCGFVNSYEDGTLMLGVDDSGTVLGCSLNRGEEDILRRQVDEAVKEITPDVFPKDYSLKFVPVFDYHGNHSGNKYIIEISVFGSTFEGSDRLYESKLGVFLRRDGSLEGPLKAKKIQEWIRRNNESEKEKLRKNERNIQKELDNVKSQSDRKGRELELKERDVTKKDEQFRLLKEDLAKKDEQYHLLKVELQKKNLEIEQQKSVIRQLEDGKQDQNQNSDETLKELGEIKQLLLSKQNKSKVCAIM